MPNTPPSDCLHRLSRAHYLGQTWVHWTLTIAERKQGWLNHQSHTTWRENLLHALVRYDLAAPVYCLMPDHVHLLLIGRKHTSDQMRALRFLRTYTQKQMLGTKYKWQHQSYDRVIREETRTHPALGVTCHYVAQNPVRASLVGTSEEWPFSGSLLPGFPEMDFRSPLFSERFWRFALEA